jgi:hypothetical protein
VHVAKGTIESYLRLSFQIANSSRWVHHIGTLYRQLSGRREWNVLAALNAAEAA